MLRFLLLTFFITTHSFAQELSKECFNKTGTLDEEANSEYCVIGKKVLRIDLNEAGYTDTVETYIDTVRAYYTTIIKIKFIKLYDAEGYQDGNFVEYFANGKTKERGSYKNDRRTGYITSFYPSGKRQSTLQYLPERGEVSHWPQIDFKILDYWDSAGVQLVTRGNGRCQCAFLSGRREVGKVVNGLRDSLWSEYSCDTLVLMEHFASGKLIEGVRYYNGKALKYTKFESFPEYKGGYESMMNHIKKNMRYPVESRRKGIDGTVYVSFTVTFDGSIKDIKVMRGISRDCDMEAVRVVRLMDPWYPGTLRGKPVNVRFNLPIKFKLN